MPQGPAELHAKWKSDWKAIEFLEQRGFVLRKTFDWVPPPGHLITENEKEAISYLIMEWDYGGLVDERT